MGRRAGEPWLIVVLAVLVMAAGACASGEAAPPRVTVPDVESTTTTTTIDVSVIPETITVEYVDAVMDKLDVIVGDAFRELVRDKGPNQKVLDLLNAVYDGHEFEAKQSVYGRIAARNFENVKSEPGNPVTRIERIIRNERDCVIAAADRDYAAWYVAPKDDIPAFVALVPKSPTSDPTNRNPTAWSVVFDAGTLDNVEPTTC